MPNEPPRGERILGSLLHPVSKTEAASLVIDRAKQATPGAYVCLTNVHTTVEARRSPQLRAAVDSAFLSVPDGMPLVWILRRRGHSRTEKITGIEYIPTVAKAGLEDGTRHFFYGGAPGVAQEGGRKLQELVPGVLVVGTSSPRSRTSTDGRSKSSRQSSIARSHTSSGSDSELRNRNSGWPGCRERWTSR